MLTIFAVSDSIGETSEQVAQAAASQFSEDVEVKRIPYVKSLEDVEEVMTEIKNYNYVMIVSTNYYGKCKRVFNSKVCGKQYISCKCIRTYHKCCIINFKKASQI